MSQPEGVRYSKTCAVKLNKNKKVLSVQNKPIHFDSITINFLVEVGRGSKVKGRRLRSKAKVEGQRSGQNFFDL